MDSDEEEKKSIVTLTRYLIQIQQKAKDSPTDLTILI